MMSYTVDDIMVAELCWSREWVQQYFGDRAELTFRTIANHYRDVGDSIWVGIRLLPKQEQMLLGCWCVRQMWDLLGADSRKAVEAAEAFARGELPKDDWAAARAAFRADSQAAARAAFLDPAQSLAREAAWQVVLGTVPIAALSAAWHAALAAAMEAAHAAENAWTYARRAQMDRLIEIHGAKVGLP